MHCPQRRCQISHEFSPTPNPDCGSTEGRKGVIVAAPMQNQLRLKFRRVVEQCGEWARSVEGRRRVG